MRRILRRAEDVFTNLGDVSTLANQVWLIPSLQVAKH